MRLLTLGSLGLLLSLVGCTVPDLGELEGGRARECNAEHRCRDGEVCLQGFCRKDPCPGQTTLTAYRDGDGDGYAAADAVAETFCGSAPADYVTESGDCDDGFAGSYPGATEACDGRDNDCRNGPDDGLPQRDVYRDGDGDGAGAGAPIQACEPPPGYVAVSGDCDDADGDRTPGKDDLCDGKDNDCVGGIDDGPARYTFWEDKDGDGHGNPEKWVLACVAPPNHVSAGDDCDDSDPERAPDKDEVCDGKDNDCANGPDDGLENHRYFRDADGDGVGTSADSIMRCGPPPGYEDTEGDCDDSDPQRRPGLAEMCDDKDNNCTGGVDEGLDKTWFRDADGDRYGIQSDSVTGFCDQPFGYVRRTAVWDCDDTRASVNPGATEVCNDVDDNCNSSTDEGSDKTWYRDADGDRYPVPSPTMTSCEQPFGYVRRTESWDCDDSRVEVKPGATERCNSRDDNCDGNTDEPFPNKGQACSNDICGGLYVCNDAQTATYCNAPAPISYYVDGDGDGDGSVPANPAKACPWDPAPAGAVTRATDCNDADVYNHGAGFEACDYRDNNCDGQRDEGNVCGGAGWNPRKDPALTGGRNWRTVALGPGGRVLVAGAGGVMAVRSSWSAPFTSLDGACGTTDWAAAWVRPSDGNVFLAGNNRLAWHDGAICRRTVSLAVTFTSIVGFEVNGQTTLYMATSGGDLFRWSPTGPLEHVFDANVYYRGVHGVSASALLLVGGTTTTPMAPRIQGYINDQGPSDHTFAGFTGHVQAVWMVNSRLAYAVGDKGVLLRWGGQSAWASVDEPPANTPDFSSVMALDPSSIYVTSRGPTPTLRRAAATGWDPQFVFTASQPLHDVALSSPSDIWAVGDNGLVMHWPEP